MSKVEIILTVLFITTYNEIKFSSFVTDSHDILWTAINWFIYSVLSLYDLETVVNFQPIKYGKSLNTLQDQRFISRLICDDRQSVDDVIGKTKPTNLKNLGAASERNGNSQIVSYLARRTNLVILYMRSTPKKLFLPEPVVVVELEDKVSQKLKSYTKNSSLSD